MNEWLDMFGLESIWNDPEFTTLDPYYKNKQIKVESVESVIDTASYVIQQRIRSN